MSSNRKQRINAGGPTDWQRLKALPGEAREELFALRESLSASAILARIEREYGLQVAPQRLSDFWRWQASQIELERLNADADQFREAFAREGVAASPEEIHIRTVDYLRMKGVREDDGKTLKFAVSEARKAIELERERERFQFDAAKAALACLPALRRIQADKALDDKSRVMEARQVLFGVTPE